MTSCTKFAPKPFTVRRDSVLEGVEQRTNLVIEVRRIVERGGDLFLKNCTVTFAQAGGLHY